MKFTLCFVIALIVLAIAQILALVMLQFVFININFWIALIFIPPIVGFVYKSIDYAVGLLPYAVFKFKTMTFWKFMAFLLVLYAIVTIIWYPNPIGLSAIPKWVVIITQLAFLAGAFTIQKQAESLAFKNKISDEMDRDIEARFNVRIK